MKKSNIGLLLIFGLLLTSCGEVSEPPISENPSETSSGPTIIDKHRVPTSEVTIIEPFADPAATIYYASISGYETLQGEDLKEALTDKLRSTVRLSQYSPHIWTAIKKSDKVVQDGEEFVRGLYTRNLIPIDNQQGNINKPEVNQFNREHTYPKSYLKVADNDQSDPYGRPNASTDFFNLFPEDYIINNRRGNLNFGEVSEGTMGYIDDSLGRQTDVNIDSRKQIIEPTDLAKGEVARAHMYMLVMWPEFTRIGQTGAIDIFLKWNLEFPPTEERDFIRNQVGQEHQNNRNPFIDDYNLGCRIWGEYDEKTKAVCNV